MNIDQLMQFKSDTYCFDSAQVTSVCLSEKGATINITGQQEDYGLIYLTYHLEENPKHETQGSFKGTACGLSVEGKKTDAKLNGVWSRSGRSVTLYSLDDVSDGNLVFAIIKINLVEESAEIYFSSFVR